MTEDSQQRVSIKDFLYEYEESMKKGFQERSDGKAVFYRGMLSEI